MSLPRTFLMILLVAAIADAAPQARWESVWVQNGRAVDDMTRSGSELAIDRCDATGCQFQLSGSGSCIQEGRLTVDAAETRAAYSGALAASEGQCQIAFDHREPTTIAVRASQSCTASCGGDLSGDYRLWPGFDCERAVSAVEKTMCDDPSLAFLGARVERLQQARLNAASGGGRRMIAEGQTRWMRNERDRAGSAEAIRALYRTRLLQLGDDPTK